MTRIYSTNRISAARIVALLVVTLAGSALADNGFAQEVGTPNQEKPRTRAERDPDPTSSIGEMIVKQQITRRRKEHEELLRRADEALKLSEELEGSVLENESLDAADIAKLESLEKIVGRIRKDLGGEDKVDGVVDGSSKENSARQNISSAFKFLRESTRSLVDELKKTSRFSVSAVAIQTSNSVIRFARILRLKK